MEKRTNLLVFFLLLALGLFAYWNCFGIMIPADNQTQFYFFSKGFVPGFSESAQSASAYFTGFPFLYVVYLIVGTSAKGWVATGILLHALNAFLLFLLADQLVKTILKSQSLLPALFAAIIFLLSPYQTESVLWGTVSVRWLFNSACSLGVLYLLVLYFKKPSAIKLLVMHFLFAIALFSNETALILPVMSVSFGFLFFKLRETTIGIPQFIIRILLIQAGCILLFFAANKLYTGYWFWHGGTMEEITRSSDPLKTLLKYGAKFLLFYRYLPFESFDPHLRAISSNTTVLVLFVCTIASIFVLFFRMLLRKQMPTGYLLAVLFACFICALIPVSPLDSSFLSYIYPDRYGYFASAFFYSLLSIGAFFLMKKIALPMMAGYAALCFMLLVKTIPAWAAANEHCNDLKKNFDPFLQYERIYVLNEPSYFNGVVAFRSALAETIHNATGSQPERIRVISGCYQNSDIDTIRSVSINGKIITVTGPEKQNPYFSTNGGWAVSYETEEYSVSFSPSGCSYTLVFKQEIPPNSAFIYTSLGSWKKAS